MVYIYHSSNGNDYSINVAEDEYILAHKILDKYLYGNATPEEEALVTLLEPIEDL